MVPLKQFQRLLGHMASAAAVTPLGLLHMRPLQHWLHSRVPRWAWRRGTLRVCITQQCRPSLSPWTDLAFLRDGVPLEQVSRHTVVYGGSHGLMDRALDLKPEVTQGCGFKSRLWQEVSTTEVRPLGKARNPQLLPSTPQCRLPTAPSVCVCTWMG